MKVGGRSVMRIGIRAHDMERVPLEELAYNINEKVFMYPIGFKKGYL